VRIALALVAVSVVALQLGTGVGAGGFPTFGAGCTRDDFESGGSVVRPELCRAASGGGRAVVVLHGCGGFSTFDHRVAAGLPAYGISTLDVDYFALTPPPGSKGFCDAVGGADAFGTWIRIVHDAAAKLGATRGIDPAGVGVAVASALRPEGRLIHAVAGFSTGSFRDASVAADLPPTILLSGGSTDTIPLAETLPLYRALRAAVFPQRSTSTPTARTRGPGGRARSGSSTRRRS
jgi:hypothetical protein